MRLTLAAARVAALVAAVLVAAFGGSASAGPPFGPSFGNTRYRTEIGPYTADEDDYVSALIAGEAISVTVTADRKSALRPVVAILDPTGADRTPAPKVLRKGAGVALRNVPIDVSGRWTVRVSGGETAGAYTVRFAVRRPRTAPLRKVRVGGADPLEREHAFQAVEGSTLLAVLRLARRSAQAGVGAVADPSGGPVPLSAPKRTGTKYAYPAAVLGAGDGEYVATVGVEEGTATYDLTLAVRPPARPRGTVALTKLEPRLGGGPYQGNSVTPVRMTGQNFSQTTKPEVWFGDARAAVLGVAVLGSAIDIVPPALPEGTVADVTIVNPDGQAVTRANYFTYSVPEPARLKSVTPWVASVYVGTTLRYTVTLTKPAPVGGFAVALTATGGVGTVPETVQVPASATLASFDLTAGANPAVGRVGASAADVSLSADVTVVPLPDGGGGGGPEDPPPPLPDEIDVSGWVVRQANSARDFTIPQGTRLRQGDYVVIARACTKAQFETYWGLTLPSNVLFLTNDPTNTSATADDWPSINGGETFELRNASGTVDGPTAAMTATALENWQRTPGQPAGAPASWTVSTNIGPGGAASPGSGQGTVAVKHGVYISEFADVPQGANQWVYEFVELHFDGNP